MIQLETDFASPGVSVISENTKTLYALEDSDQRALSTRKEGLPSKQKED